MSELFIPIKAARRLRVDWTKSGILYANRLSGAQLRIEAKEIDNLLEKEWGNSAMESEQQSKLTLTVGEVATLLRISRGACYEAVRMGQIPSLRFGRRIVIPKVALQLLLAGEEKNINGKNPDE